MSLDRPVLITGTPRSGKTCVWNVLLQAGEFAAAGEPLMIWDFAFTGRPDDRWGADLATPTTVERVREKCLRVVRRAGARRYLDNLAYHALRLPFIYAAMPEARVIHVVRDPLEGVPECLFGWTNRDTVRRSIAWRWRNTDPRSLPRLAWRFARNYARTRVRGVRETWGPRVPGLADYVRSHTPAEIAAWQWVRTVEIARSDTASLPGLRLLEVRYEDLVNRPREQARRIADFVEAEEPDSLVEFAAGYWKADYVHYEACRREPEPEDWERVRPMLDPLRVELGYVEADRR